MSRAGLDESHDPARTSWVAAAGAGGDFPIQNLPLGRFAPPGHGPRPMVAIGDQALDLVDIADLLPEAAAATLAQPGLNALFALPAADRRALRRRLSALLADPAQAARLTPSLHPIASCTPHLPAQLGDYSDFYVGIHHARQVGALFRPDAPLLPNYAHVPIGYHGRASSVRASGVPVVRPHGQSKAADAAAPRFGPSARLDYELELGLWIGTGNALGTPIPIAEAEAHLVGLCLLNDWSARDLQAWEYQPLGPFLGKSFHTSVSPWVVTAEALAPFRRPPAPREEGAPAPLPYLQHEEDAARGGFSIRLEAFLSSAAMRAAGHAPLRLAEVAAADAMYWTVAQIIAHHSSNGCNLRPGDLIGTGTLSTPGAGGAGSLLEQTRGGAAPITLPGGETRRFLEDGDRITLRARAEAPGAVAIGFGEVTAEIVAAAG
ncbi:fumarylacetoacetase [Sphingomonas morindae]|uniref:fumarylacetoacetase n=1 Tax=Sphingomonas morindae TaxID=1541170 RepID=A0ABY4X499_9SPHN|nr:fumarylacetoacetase [Sphingomonas morindae]USI71727.1 fumarylacetoacetase [Sphingomonas morindae]